MKLTVNKVFLNQLEYEKRSLDVIMKNYEAKIFESLYKKYPSTRKLAKRLGISHSSCEQIKRICY